MASRLGRVNTSRLGLALGCAGARSVLGNSYDRRSRTGSSLQPARNSSGLRMDVDDSSTHEFGEKLMSFRCVFSSTLPRGREV